MPHMVRRVISSDTARTVSRILEDVVSERGTAPPAAIEGYRVAGKTSTAQKVDPRTGRYSHRNFTAAFVGFAPINRPRLVILVMIDEPRGVTYGGLVAGPVFKEIGQWALGDLKVQPQLRLAGAEAATRNRTV